MTPGNMPRPSTAEEFEKMMTEFDLAGEWMREQLALGHGAMTSLPLASAEDETGLVADGEEN
ncbi:MULTISPECIES: hypothetical protein [Pseudomonas]|uniref:Uncharacterized protein n=2 Tax=Pseudomonas savastanoi TaxID=29438 RepID=A0AB74BQY7_PSESS|nr:MULTISPECIES: hypothetical protein [Pseudomonas]ARD13735.1 hypothetical protein PSA3335_23420 [Pseudomonas savastanoi pv. savastanoi NCPPB 3335]KAA3538436.1 hypothetical protein DXU85_21200 [Pseudomonas savastanoi]KPB20840.1 hypothetical protein AC519_2574 [Pseudomonas savastanoi]KPY65052.1 Uncharacterized protein ALO58_00659 [Pseudomonas savastanoi pv. savastanoi]KUG40991.1 Uncharacterized protein ALP79_01855 [Pseudomonas savastanoi pv. fraxini]